MTRLRGKLIGIPVETLAQPREGDTVVDRWWAVQDGCAIFYQGTGSKGWVPQCNRNQHITESLVGRPTLYPDADAHYIPVAFLGRWDENWGHMLSPDLLAAAIVLESGI